MRKLWIIAVVSGLTAVGPLLAWADWDHHGHPGFHANHAYYHYHDHPHWGVHVHAFYPDEYYPIWVGGGQYYYDDGIYYNDINGVYEVAAPPVGAVVGAIPSDFQPMVINGTTYYTNNGTYYVSTPNGYKVVQQPVQTVSAQNTFVINVPSHKGGYVAVTIKRAGNGFVGPQGEFYSTFPQVSQLKVMYGK